MVALQRDSAPRTEAAMKYFVLGALASGMLLYGMSMIYGATGTLDIARRGAAHRRAARRIAHDPGVRRSCSSSPASASSSARCRSTCGCPDVYHGAPTAVTLFIGSAPKLAAFAFIMRLLVEALGAEQLVADWQQMLVILAVLSLAIGNITAIAQTNLKRMLAYSTISHMGFLLLGMLGRQRRTATASAMFYVVVYVLMTLGAFGMILLLSRAGFEAENLDDFKGLNQRSPWYAFIMLLLMFSMAGIPPTVGFYAKLVGAAGGRSSAGYVWLAVVAVLFSLVGAFYYLRIVKLMYFDAPVDTAPIAPRADVARAAER